MATKSTSTTRKSTSAKKTSAQKPAEVTPISSVNRAAAGDTSIAPDNTPATQVHPGIEDEIRRRAYELYEQRGRNDGQHHDDWARAETEILSKYQRGKSA